MKFEFATSAHILFGAGGVTNAPTLIRSLGMHALLVTGKTRDVHIDFMKSLTDLGIAVTQIQVLFEPDIDLVEQGSILARSGRCDVVIGFGGGSVLDAAKAIAALATNSGPALNYLEVIGNAQPLGAAPLPIVAIPTTAGTGSEVTRNSVLSSHAKKLKVSLRHELMLPRIAIVDPELTYTQPANVTAYSGMDALTQLIEPFLSPFANPLTDGFCLEGITRAARSLRRVFENGADIQAREDMSFASLLGGLALANARLGAVHGFAGVLGGMFQAGHGAICAKLLPLVLRENLHSLSAKPQNAETLLRMRKIATLLTNNSFATAEDGIYWIEDTNMQFDIPNLSRYGVSQEDIPNVVRQARSASSMKGNPVVLSDDELAGVLQAAL